MHAFARKLIQNERGPIGQGFSDDGRTGLTSPKSFFHGPKSFLGSDASVVGQRPAVSGCGWLLGLGFGTQGLIFRLAGMRLASYFTIFL